MLWYKSWLETRSRFMISLLGSVALCSFYVYHWDKEAMPYTKPEYYYYGLHGGHSLLCVLWVLTVTLLTMGGLLRERAAGTAPFTLALPVSRMRLMATRVSVGVLQAMALVIFPWSAMFLIGGLTGKTHSTYQAFFHIVLLAGGGIVFFGVAFLISSLVEGEYTAPIVSFGILLVVGVVLGNGSLRGYSPWDFIAGADYFDRTTGLLIGPIPWMHIVVSILLGALFVAISAKAIQTRDF